ncbi:MAG: response regulator [Desulfobacterales bacterium]|jgi:PAS domain S-box-containing protein|nr:response regulator [Desulfobacterales bacterium]
MASHDIPQARCLRWAWLPIPVFLGVMFLLLGWNVTSSYESPYFLLALNFIFIMLASLIAAYLAARAFLVNGELKLMMLGCGLLLWGFATIVATVFIEYGANVSVTIHNLGVMLSAGCHITAAIISTRSNGTTREPGLWLVGAYTCTMGIIGLVAIATLAGWTPVFFIQNSGGTTIRQVGLGSAIGMFITTAWLMGKQYHRSPSAFLYWYANGLALLAVGLLGVMMQSAQGTLLGWTGRTAQILGGIYILIAVITAVRDSRVWGFPLETVLHDTQARLEEQIERYELVFAGVGAAIWDWDVLNKRVVFSSHWKSMRGLTDEDVSDREEEWSSNIHPEDTSRVFTALQAHFNGKTPSFSEEYRIRCKDGSWKWVFDCGLAKRDAVGGVVRMAGSEMDITERKIAELKLVQENREIALVNRILRVFAEASGDELFDQVLKLVQEGLSSRHGVFGYITEPGHLTCPSLTRMLDECEVAGKCIHYPPEKWKGLWARALREKRPFYTNEASSVPAGHPPIRNNLAAPIIFHGEVIGLLNLANKEGGYIEADRVLLDAMAGRIAPLLYAWIQKKLREEESAKTKEALWRMNETLEQRVADRTALANARTKQLQSLAVELIETEERERRRIAHLLHEDLQQILAAARFQLQALRPNLVAEPILENVTHLLEESITKARRLSHELSPAVLYHSGLIDALKWLAEQMKKQFGLRVYLEAAAGQTVESMPIKIFMFRAIQELLFNVVKHAHVKSARIVISGSTDNVIAIVSDQGRGFDSNVLEPSTPVVGLGLLSIKERASYIGGSLVIESEPGRGSRFILALPLGVSKIDSMSPFDLKTEPPPDTPVKDPEIAGVKGISVLFADDHLVIRQGLIRLITGRPGIILAGEATTGYEAVDLARRLRPDVVLMDISMPEMDGIEATHRIKAELPQIRVIGLSMYEDEQISRAILEAGAEAFLNKAASASDLLKAIYANTGHNLSAKSA